MRILRNWPYTLEKYHTNKAKIMSNLYSASNRTTVSLDGEWQFSHETDGKWRQILVPMPWQAQFDDLRQSFGTATYRRAFAGRAVGPDQVVVLHFGAVSYHATVRLNGQQIGTHEGGYLPFECRVPPELINKTNVLEVIAVLPDANSTAHPDFPFAEIPHGKQSWYGPIGGIWQSVHLVVRNRCSLQSCAISPDLTSGMVQISIALTEAGEIGIEIFDMNGDLVANGRSATGQQADISIAVENPAAWSPDHPALYRARITVTHDGSADVTDHSFGFRSFATSGGKMFLNGAEFYMRGALDQDYYPLGICTPPSLEFLEDQIRKAKALGLNLLRCHIKVPDPRYYEVADRLGMLIWTEIPNVAAFTSASARRMQDTMRGILARDGNHPSIVIWTLINEDWGTRLIEDASHRKWLRDMYDWLKAADPTRLVVDNSACHYNFHVKTDLNDYHYYRSVPERRSEWDAITRDFATGPDWTFSPFGDAERRGDEPLIVSEFGVWGLPNPAEVANADGSEPWWMETGSVWGDGVAYPHGVQNRFATFQLGSVFGSFGAFIAAAQWYQFANLKYEIEVMRAEATIQGYVITEFTDVHWESNGLLDMNRNPRVFHEVFATINADVVIVPRVADYFGIAGQPFRFDVAVATGAARMAAGHRLHWQIAGGESGALDVAKSGTGAVIEVGTVTLTLPEMPHNQMVEIGLHLRHGDVDIARNSVSIAVYAARAGVALPSFASDDAEIAAHLGGLGYRQVTVHDAEVVVVHAMNASDIRALRDGARYLILADGTRSSTLRIDDAPQVLMPELALVARHGTIWRGDWIAGFSWIRRKGAFAGLPGGPLLDLSFDRVVPHHVLTGFKPWEFSGLVHAGMVTGWIHKPAAFIGERRFGRGSLIAATFRLLGDAPGVDPVATALLDALMISASVQRVDQ